MTEVWIVNGHLPTCAYIQSLDDLEGHEACTCSGWDDEDEDYEDYDDSDYNVDGDATTDGR
jgi:hypothetical protein